MKSFDVHYKQAICHRKKVFWVSKHRFEKEKVYTEDSKGYSFIM